MSDVHNSLDGFKLEYQEYEANSFVKIEAPFAFPRLKKLWFNLQDIVTAWKEA